ncbi:MAG TPA: MOSC domain-containing protein [Magnetospirillaceae bacterium]|jgi:GntR family transcriptional regulator/MocR family aminotransferase
MAAITHIFRYPIKGLSPEALDTVTLTEGQGLPYDRIFALTRPGGAVDPDRPAWARKSNFLCLMLDEQLAAIRTEFDETTRRLVVWQDGVPILAANVDDAGERKTIEGFFRGLVGDNIPSAPRFVTAANGEFMDSKDKTVSLINLASIRHMEEKWGEGLDLRRFRANIYVDGLEPWIEHQWIGATLSIGGTRCYVDRRNARCAAVNVDPATGERDMNIPRAMIDSYGHADLGLNLHVHGGGPITVGDTVTVLEA